MYKIKGQDDEILLIGMYNKFCKIECKVIDETNKPIRKLVKIDSNYDDLYSFTNNPDHKGLYIKPFKKDIEYIYIIDREHFTCELFDLGHIEIIYKNKSDNQNSKKELLKVFDVFDKFSGKFPATKLDQCNDILYNIDDEIDYYEYKKAYKCLRHAILLYKRISFLKDSYNKGQYFYVHDFKSFPQSIKELESDLNESIKLLDKVNM